MLPSEVNQYKYKKGTLVLRKGWLWEVEGGATFTRLECCFDLFFACEVSLPNCERDPRLLVKKLSPFKQSKISENRKSLLRFPNISF